MGDVVDLNCITSLDLPADRILNKAVEADLDTAVVVGWKKNGEFYFASTTSDGGNVLWLFEVAKLELMKVAKVIE